MGRDCFEDDDVKLREDDQDFKFRQVIFDDGLLEKHGHVVQISAGDSHTAALTNKGSVLIWGTFRVSRQQIFCVRFIFISLKFKNFLG